MLGKIKSKIKVEANEKLRKQNEIILSLEILTGTQIQTGINKNNKNKKKNN